MLTSLKSSPKRPIRRLISITTAIAAIEATLLDSLSLSGDSVDRAGDEITTWLDGLGLN